jgi:hypothetical protein
MERRDPSTSSTDELPRTYSTDELLRMTTAHRIRLTQRQITLKRELCQRAAELAAIEETLEEVIATENRLMRDRQTKTVNLRARRRSAQTPTHSPSRAGIESVDAHPSQSGR